MLKKNGRDDNIHIYRHTRTHTYTSDRLIKHGIIIFFFFISYKHIIHSKFLSRTPRVSSSAPVYRYTSTHGGQLTRGGGCSGGNREDGRYRGQVGRKGADGWGGGVEGAWRVHGSENCENCSRSKQAGRTHQIDFIHTIAVYHDTWYKAMYYL